MKNLKKKLILGVAGGLMILSAVAGVVTVTGNGPLNTQAKVNEYEGQHRVAKVNEYEGQHRAVALLTRKVNEYEGQH